MNPAPAADVQSVGQENFDWIVDAVARMAVERAQANDGQGPELRWAALLGHQAELAGAAKKAAKKGPPPPKKAPAKKDAGVKGAPEKGPAKKTAAKKQAANASREEDFEA